MAKFSIALLVVTIAIIAGIALSGCSKKEEETPPTIPPTSTMTANFTAFQGSGFKVASPETLSPHFRTAATAVLTWDAIITLALVAPVTLARIALLSTPTHESTDWVWTYGGHAAEGDWNVVLRGNEVGSTVNWSLFVTGYFREEGRTLTDFKWYEGSVDRTGKVGWWQFYTPESLHYAAPSLRMDFAVTDSTHKYITFRNTMDWKPEYHDSLRYDLSGTAASALWWDVDSARSVLVNWDIITKAGSIRYPNDTWGCWDSTKQTIDCVSR